jgi:hypothetical protein
VSRLWVEGGGWVDADTVARYLSVERDWVYSRALELGGRRLTDGPKARWRFRLEDVDRRLTCNSGRESESAETRVAEPVCRRRSRPSMGTTVELLPIRGEQAA